MNDVAELGEVQQQEDGRRAEDDKDKENDRSGDVHVRALSTLRDGLPLRISR
jgi:hypothetical protein